MKYLFCLLCLFVLVVSADAAGPLVAFKRLDGSVILLSPSEADSLPCCQAQAPVKQRGKTPRPDGQGFCSDACCCGCNEGLPCTCGVPQRKSAVNGKVAPACEDDSCTTPPVQYYQPSFSGGGRRGGGGGRRGGGGC